MKIQPDKFDVQSISGYGADWVSIAAEKIITSVVIGSRGQRVEWGCHVFDDLSTDHFDMLAALAPEIVIFGSGSRIRFPKPQWLAPLYAKRIGVETMDMQAACRTYNILAGEGRNVVLALLIERLPP